MKKIGLFVLASTMMVGAAIAQVKTPAPSPKAEVEQALGLTEIEIEYSRPSMKGRTIFGDLVPYDKLWRTGANAPTVVKFDDDVTIEGNKVEEGKYALFTIPGKDKWTVILNSNTKNNVYNYDNSTEVAKFDVTPSKMADTKETFTIGFDNLRDNECTMYLAWENTRVSMKISVNTDEAVMASIKKEMAGPSAGSYYQAARYYHENGKDKKEALNWINKANELDPGKYWMMKWKAEIQASNGLTKEAIATAKEAKALAEKAGNQEYVKINEENIAKWSKK